MKTSQLTTNHRGATSLLQRLAKNGDVMDFRLACINELLSSGAFAERAAAQQCKIIAAQFEVLGLQEYQKIYERIEKEEKTHFRLLEQCCNPLVTPRSQAIEVYMGRKLFSQTFLLERMVIVHLVFEPAALAFLGSISKFIGTLPDSEWRETLSRNVGVILNDETQHIADTENIIRRMIDGISATERTLLRRSIRKHSAFLTLGLKSIFDETDPVLSDWLREMEMDFRKMGRKVQEAVDLI